MKQLIKKKTSQQSLRCVVKRQKLYLEVYVNFEVIKKKIGVCVYNLNYLFPYTSIHHAHPNSTKFNWSNLGYYEATHQMKPV
jgi:hypothetical protein